MPAMYGDFGDGLLSGAERREWMGMGVAGIIRKITIIDHSLIPYV